MTSRRRTQGRESGAGSGIRSAPGGSTLGELVKRWMKESRAEERLDPEGLFQRWKDVVGEEVAAQTRIVSADRGELVVEVASAALLNELATYRTREILDALAVREEFRGIRKLRFRAGCL
ncbi:MAG: DUF721 domain-containing protein [Planctomycetota bacterium]